MSDTPTTLLPQHLDPLADCCPVCRFGATGTCDERCETIASRVARGLPRGVDTGRMHGPARPTADREDR